MKPRTNLHEAVATFNRGYLKSDEQRTKLCAELQTALSSIVSGVCLDLGRWLVTTTPHSYAIRPNLPSKLHVDNIPFVSLKDLSHFDLVYFESQLIEALERGLKS